MKINIEPFIRVKYMPGFDRSLKDITEIIIHGTAGGTSAQAVINWMIGGEREDLYNAGIGLFHYIIDLNGDTYEIIDSSKWVYHSDCSSHDKHTIGIEMLNTQLLNAGSYTVKQYEALKELIVELIKKFPIDSITSHDVNRYKYSNLNPKPCPGYLFNWDMVDEAVEETERTLIVTRG